MRVTVVMTVGENNENLLGFQVSEEVIIPAPPETQVAWRRSHEDNEPIPWEQIKAVNRAVMVEALERLLARVDDGRESIQRQAAALLPAMADEEAQSDEPDS